MPWAFGQIISESARFRFFPEMILIRRRLSFSLATLSQVLITALA